MLAGEVDPCMAVGNTDDKIAGNKAKGEHRLDSQRDQLRIGGRSALAEDIDIELVEFTSPALLRFFIAETLADLKPLERFRKMALMLRNEPSQRGRYLRPQCHITPTLIFEAEKLRGKLATGFF